MLIGRNIQFRTSFRNDLNIRLIMGPSECFEHDAENLITYFHCRNWTPTLEFTICHHL